MKKTGLILVCLFFSVTVCQGAVFLDTNFSTDGKIIHNGAAGGTVQPEYGYKTVSDSSGNIYVAGEAKNGSNVSKMAVWKYKNDGTLDPSFDSDGIFIHAGAAGASTKDYANDICFDAVGRILVVGLGRNAAPNDDIVVWRLNTNGTLDTTFNSTGYKVISNLAGIGNDVGMGVAVDSNGRILVSGYSNNGSNNDAVLIRLTSSGALDTTFNTTGYVIKDGIAGSTQELAYDVAVDADGKIYLTGEAQKPDTNYDMFLLRFNSDGSDDTDFDTDGKVLRGGTATGYAAGISVKIDSNKKPVVAGYAVSPASFSDIYIWRFNTNGSLDTTFNLSGYFVKDAPAGATGGDGVEDIIIDMHDRVIFVGNGLSTVSGTDPYVGRLNSDGSADSTFAAGGVSYLVKPGGGTASDPAKGVALDPSGRIIVAGYASTASVNSDMMLLVYGVENSSASSSTAATSITLGAPNGDAALTIGSGVFAAATQVTLKTCSTIPSMNKTDWTASSIGVQVAFAGTAQAGMTLTLSFPVTTSLTANKFMLAWYDEAAGDWSLVVGSKLAAGQTKVSGTITKAGIYQVVQFQGAPGINSQALKPYPHPFRPASSSTVAIAGVAPSTVAKIYTVNGEKVAEVTANAVGVATWDGKNTGGTLVGSGIYIVALNDGTANRTVKIAVER